MDIATLSALAITTLTPYLVKSGEAIAEESGKGLWNWLGEWFHSKGEKPVLEKLAQNPKDAETIGEAKATLKSILKENDTLIGELTALVEAAKAQQIKMDGNSTLNVMGDNNIVNERNTNSTITITTNYPPKV